LVARQNLLATEVTPIGNGLQFVDAEDCLRLASDVGELRPICTVVCYLNVRGRESAADQEPDHLYLINSPMLPGMKKR